MIKFIAIDLDGTLLPSNGIILEDTKKLIKEHLDNETHIVPCSGRPYDEIPDWFKQQEKIKYIISSNGARITNNLNGCDERILVLDNKIALAIIEKTINYNVQLSLIIDGKVHVLKNLNNEVNYPSYEYLDDIEKIHYYFPEISQKEMVMNEIGIFDNLNITSSYATNLEISNLEASKGHAINYLLNVFDIDKQHVIGIGDNDNDISMMEAVNYSYAMKNASANLKDVALNITSRDNNEGGVNEVLLKHLTKK